MADAEAGIRQRFKALSPLLDEQLLRRFVAAEAIAAGYGGVSLVSGLLDRPSTINRGIDEINENRDAGHGRVRRAGGGRKSKISNDPALLDDLKARREPATRGDPMQPLLWTSKSLRHLSAALKKMGHDVCNNVVADLLRALGYSLQANRKTREGAEPSRPRRPVRAHQRRRCRRSRRRASRRSRSTPRRRNWSATSRTAGASGARRAQPEPVRVHDFPIPELGKAVPYGVYDIAANAGWVSVGIDHDTAGFAVETHPPLVAATGRGTLPRRQAAADHRRLRRQQRRARAAVEGRTADAGRRDRARDHRLPPPARHQQVEQDRAPPVRLHHPELARQAAGQPSGHRPADRRHHHPHRPDGPADLDPNTYRQASRSPTRDRPRQHPAATNFHGEWNYTIARARRGSHHQPEPLLMDRLITGASASTRRSPITPCGVSGMTKGSEAV